MGNSSVGKNSACNAEDPGSIPGLGRSLGEGKGYPLQYSGLENSIDCIVYGVTKSQTRLSDFIFYGLSHNFEYSSLFYTVGPCLSILNVIVCIYQNQTPSPSLFLPASPLATQSLCSTSLSLSNILKNQNPHSKTHLAFPEKVFTLL